MTAAPKFLNAAPVYGERGIACVSLIPDDDGQPKAPSTNAYPSFRPKNNTVHDWERTSGLGIILGKPSGGLAVIDVDSEVLSDYLLRRTSEWTNPPLMVQTPDKRLHTYCAEPAPTPGVTDLEVHYNGVANFETHMRRHLVQLVGAGCQAAAPPTPGYSWINPKSQPMFGTLSEVWKRIALEFNLPTRHATRTSFMRHERSAGPTTEQIRGALV